MKKNNKKSVRRSAADARQEQEGKKVVMWIGAVLIVLALCIMAYSAYVMS